MKKRCLAIIPARGGSKGLPGKNLRLFAGRPLIEWAIACGLKSSSINRVVVSSDCDKILEISAHAGAIAMKRPDTLATDTALVIEAVKYTVTELEQKGEYFDIICLLEPTSPFRSPNLVDECVGAVAKGLAQTSATFSAAPISPNRLWRIEGDFCAPYFSEAIPWQSRQKQPKAFVLNGLVYAFARSHLRDHDSSQVSILDEKIYPILITEQPSVDIDTSEEFDVAEFLFKKWNG